VKASDQSTGSPQSRAVRLDRRFLVGSVGGLRGQPVLAPDRFNEHEKSFQLNFRVEK
jgi:hypothetical protein